MISFTILGQPCSKANSRELSTIGAKAMDVVVGRNEDGSPKTERMKVGGRILNRKSDDALEYESDALRQIPPKARQRIEGPVRVTLRLFYASERPDLDESIVLDVLQDRWKTPTLPNGEKGERVLLQRGVYRNDRQVREKHVFHGIDKAKPRAEVVVEPMQMQQPDLLEGDPRPAYEDQLDPRTVPF